MADQQAQRRNPGDGGAAPGGGSLDATDRVPVTGETLSARPGSEADAPVAADPDYQKGGASGALGPEDVDPGSGGREFDYGPDSTGPEATTGPDGGPGAPGGARTRDRAVTGGAEPHPTEPGTTNLPGPSDRTDRKGRP